MNIKIATIILFFIILIGLMTYVMWHVWTLVPLPRWGKATLVSIVCCCFLLAFVSLSPLMNPLPLGLASFVYNLGNKTLIILVYLLMAFVLLDLCRLLHLLPKTALHDSLPTTIILLLTLTAIFVYGSLHYHHKQRVEITLDSHGKIEKPIKIVMASDLHIGYPNRRADLAKWIDLINSENPDLVLIAGDIIDLSLRPVVEESMAEEFLRIKAPVFACLGNHEYMSGKSKVLQFYKDANIHLLVDSAAVVDGVEILGRDDRSNRHRKDLSDFDIDPSLYTILLDHQPSHLEEAEANHIDFQFSGHTHGGQVWPLSWLVRAMYECYWGSHQRGDTHYYVSSGLGIWGAKYRIGTQSEYIVATVR